MLSQNVQYYTHILKRLNLNCNIQGLKLQAHLLDIMFSQLVVQSMRATKGNYSKLVTQLKLSMMECLFLFKRIKGRPDMEIVFGTALVLIHFFLLIVIVWSTFKVYLTQTIDLLNAFVLEKLNLNVSNTRTSCLCVIQEYQYCTISKSLYQEFKSIP